MTRSLTIGVLIVAVLTMMCTAAEAGLFDDIKDKLPGADDVKDKLKLRIPDLGRILDEGPAIATSFDDAVTGVPFLDDLDPTVTAPMTQLPPTGDGAFIVALPGMYELEARSFCLHAGTYGPGQGEGYLYAPLKGNLAGVIQSVLDRYMAHPEIEQRKVQSLIWGIQAKTKISEMPGELREVAEVLLTEREIRRLNGGALGMVPEELFDQAFVDVPEEVRMVLEAEARLRNRLSRDVYDFDALEEVAVLSGEPPAEEGGPVVPLGRWSFHPDGFFVRYFPHGYSRTTVQLYDPEPFDVIADELGRITRIANPYGYAIEAEYGDARMELPGDDGVHACALTALRLVSPDGEALALDVPPEAVTLVGLPSGDGRPAGAAGELYDLAEETLQQVRELASHVEGASPDSALASNVIDLTHFTNALEAVVGEADSQMPALRQWLNMTRRASASELFLMLKGVEPGETMQTRSRRTGTSVRLACLSLSGALWAAPQAGTRTPIAGERLAYRPGEMQPLRPKPYPYYPSGGAGTPANRDSQRLGQSGASHRELPDFKPDAGDDDDDSTPSGGQGKDAFNKAQKALDWFDTAQTAIGIVTDPVGTAVETVGFGIRDQMFSGLFDFWFSSAKNISQQLGGDPPRSDFTEIATPEPIGVPELAVEDALSAEHAAALNDLAETMAHQLSLLRAAQICRDRLGGALAAGQDEWAMRQAAALTDYKRQIGHTWIQISTDLRQVLQAVRALGIRDMIITPEAAAAYQQRLRAEGFNDAELAAAEVLGLSDAELQEMLQARLAADPDEMAGSIMAHTEELATALRTLGASWATLPSDRAGWVVEEAP